MKERKWVIRIGEKIIECVCAGVAWTKEQVRYYLVYTLGYDEAIDLTLVN